MTILVAFIAAVIFALGTRRSADLANALREPVLRQQLLLRVVGFVAVSIWLHLLPRLLLVVYMRQEEILATEALTDSSVVGSVSTLYTFLSVLLLATAASAAAIEASLKDGKWRPFSIVSWSAYLVGLVTLRSQWQTGGHEHAIFLLATAAPIGLYISLSLLTPLEKQFRLFWLPFAIIAAETSVLLMIANGTHKLVSTELAEYGIGGNRWVVITAGNKQIAGRLLFRSDDFAYIAAISDDGSARDCKLRIPIAGATVATGTFGDASVERRIKEPLRVLDKSQTYRAFAESTRELCGRKLAPDYEDSRSQLENGGTQTPPSAPMAPPTRQK